MHLSPTLLRPAPLPEPVTGLLAALFEHSDLAIAAYDPSDVLVHASPAFERRFLRGLPVPVPFADVLRHGFARGFGVKVDCGDVERFLRDILPRRRNTPSRGFQVDTVEGEWLWVNENLLPGGWMVSVASNITPLKRDQHQLRLAHANAHLAARTDALTGAPNRRAVLETGEALLRQCRELRLPFALAMIDLDRFKLVNDGHGHAVGDAVLQGFVRHCEPALRAGDVLGRLGGEEFLLLLPNARWPLAATVCDRLRDGLQPLPLADGLGEGLSYSFSAGVAEAKPRESLEALMRRADAAMYRAKALGRGRTEVAAPE
jgi:diguanylate cyclase (GGDEF)-like protein